MVDAGELRRKYGIDPGSNNAPKSKPEDWTKLRNISSWGNRRRFRRFVVLLWIAMLAIDPWIVFRLAQSFSVLAKLPAYLLPTLTQLLITWLAFRSMQIGLAQPTLEDSAVTLHGEEFDALTDAEREELFQQRFQDFIQGRIEKDEREAELRLRAETAAYRLLRPGLCLVVAAYWAVCMLGPFDAIRETLAVTAIAVTWIAVAVLVLPTMIRMWTQPNEVGETRIARSGKQGR